LPDVQRHCEERSDEAIQRPAHGRGGPGLLRLRLAMTART
jgi:hypothetical protein